MVLKQGLAFHCHHDKLYEFVYDYDERVEFIKSNKPQEEQELRLRLFKLIPMDLVPGKDTKEYLALDKAWAARNKAREALDKAWVARNKAGVALDKAREARNKAGVAYEKVMGKEMVALHKEICPDCPWDGNTILGRR